MRTGVLVSTTALLLLCACAPAANIDSPTPSVTQSAAGVTSGTASTVTVVVGDARPVRAEIADTPAERGHGLMGRPSLPAGTGMLFLFPGRSRSSFFMWQTLVPLSIAFVDVDRVISVAEMTPCEATTPADCPQYEADAAYTAAIEAPANWFTDADVQPGDPVSFDPTPPPATS